MDIFQTFIGALFGGGLIAFIEFLIRRHDERGDKNSAILKAIDSLGKEIDKLGYKLGEREAILARSHILKFNDELYCGIEHTREYFDQILDDITDYNQYCENHPTFKNERTVMAAQHIHDTYRLLEEKHKFL